MRPSGLRMRRVWAVVYRHLALLRHSWLESAEVVYAPTLQMLVWGFAAAFVVSAADAEGATAGAVFGGLVGAVLLWEITIRSQVGLTNAFMEEMWSRNLTQLFVSPVRPAEFVLGLFAVSAARTAAGVVPAAMVARWIYGYSLLDLGAALPVAIGCLTVMGWAVAMLVVALVLRFGMGVQTFAWSLIAVITPFAAVFYPIAILPAPLRVVASSLPASHVFEIVRSVSAGRGLPLDAVARAVGLDVAWFAGACVFLARQLTAARRSGAIMRMSS